MEINGPWAAAGFRKAGIDLGIAQGAGRRRPARSPSARRAPLISRRPSTRPRRRSSSSWWTGKTAQAQFSKQSGFPPARTDLTVSDPTTAVFAQALPNARLYLAGLPSSSQIDSDVYMPLLGQLTRGADAQKSADAAAKSINALTGCKS